MKNIRENYIAANKAAWEETFDNRRPNWGEDNYRRLNEPLAFFNDDMKNELSRIDFNGKKIAQFCCNNGRELLSLMAAAPSAGGVGFDIAENIIGQARETAEKAGVKNCDFIACNILDIPERYHRQFDLIFFTIGAITWFEDLTLLFEKVASCLKPGGRVIINDYHPLVNMLLLPGDDGFSPDNLNRWGYSYFRKEPWIENNGMGYISEAYASKTFTSFSHTLSGIINALSQNGMKTCRLNEYDHDIGAADIYDNKGIPLSFILMAEKY